jgi:hypothetical protein
MTISTGEFDAYGIPQGSPNRMDDLADVDTTEAKEGNTIQVRGGRWVAVDGNEVAIQAGQPPDLGVELWVDPNIPDPPPALDQQTANGLYVNVVGDTMTGPLVVNSTIQSTGSATVGSVSTAGAVSATGVVTSESMMQVNNLKGLVLHSPGVSVTAMGSFIYGGAYGMRFTGGWEAGSGSLAPLQIGAPIDGNSAATVAWVQGNGYATGGRNIGLASVVVTTNTAGQGGVDVGRPFTNVVMNNGDFEAMARAATSIWPGASATIFYFGNTNASSQIRINCVYA